MAKCVYHAGRIKRVSDEEAERLVKAGAKYVSKNLWRHQKGESQ